MENKNRYDSLMNELNDVINQKAETSGKHTLEQIVDNAKNISTGIDTTDATATSNDILLGRTAYVNDEKVEGAIPTYDGQVEGVSVDETIQINIDRQKYKDYMNLLTNSVNDIVTDEEYMIAELKCQKYYSRIMGV